MNLDRVCVDASLAITWLLLVQQDDHADILRRQWREHGVQLIGPAMFHAEVTSVLREEVFFRRLSPQEGEEAFLLYSSIPIRIVDSPAVYKRGWQLAGELDQHRTYDMQYLAVAELEDCEFWTADRKLINSLKGRNRRVRWIGEFGTGSRSEDAGHELIDEQQTNRQSL